MRTLGLLVAMCLSGCMTTYRAQSFLERKNALAAVCADKYPVVGNYKTGEWVGKVDTSYIVVDTGSVDRQIRYIPVHDTTKLSGVLKRMVVIDSLLRVDTLRIVDQARVKELANQAQLLGNHITELSTRLDGSQKRNMVMYWIIFALLVPWLWKGGSKIIEVVLQAEKRIP